MTLKSIVLASVFSILAVLSEGSLMHAAEKNPREPGATDKDAPK